MIGPGDSETLQNRARRNAVAEEHHMIHDGGMRAAFGIGEFGVGGGQGHVSDRFQPDAVMRPIEPDQRLALRVGAINTRVDPHHFAGGIQRGLIEGTLDIFSGKNLPAILPPDRAKTGGRPLNSQGQRKPCAPRHHPTRACFMAVSEASVLHCRPDYFCLALTCLNPTNLRQPGSRP